MFSGKISSDKRIIKSAIAGVILLMIFISFWYDPVNYKITDCAFKDMTGLSCPGCGLSRSFHSTAHLNLAYAFGFHLLGPVFFLMLLLISVIYSFEAISGNNIKTGIKKRTGKILVIAVLTIWFIYWIARMAGEI
ncbi:MAG: DUF2752 domain-containing protein [Bacteroidales bacterium]|nr:DUF2752 domain-containing protein [Bacteroidales bacterium]